MVGTWGQRGPDWRTCDRGAAGHLPIGHGGGRRVDRVRRADRRQPGGLRGYLGGGAYPSAPSRNPSGVSERPEGARLHKPLAEEQHRAS